MATAPFLPPRPLARVRRAWPHEAPALGALAARALAAWGYVADEMAVLGPALRLTPEALRTRRVFVLEARGRLAGFYTLAPDAGASGEVGSLELTHLSVEPAFRGFGLGSHLLAHAREQARRSGHARLRVRSDPHAERFYRLHGAARLWLAPTELPGRSLLVLEIPV